MRELSTGPDSTGPDPAGPAQVPLIEACVSSASEAVAAARAGVHRLELCSALELGGLTPSRGTLQTVLAHVSLPVVVMIRPRAGGFCYDTLELETMRRDATELLAAGASGIVFGCLTSAGDVDLQSSETLVQVAQQFHAQSPAAERAAIFHRAFDFVRQPLAALEQLIDIGVQRVLSSGGKATAMEGVDTLAALQRAARGRIEILPGGGIRADNLLELLRRSGCAAAHVGASLPITDGSLDHLPNLNLCDTRCLAEHRYRQLDAAAVTAVTTVAKEWQTSP